MLLAATNAAAQQFRVEEATIAGIHAAMTAKRLTSVQLVRLYLDRIKAYNGTCVLQPEGLLKVITPIRDAGRINALQTVNLRPPTRKAMGFDDRKARSVTDAVDDNPAMPDALQVAADLDRRFAQTGRLTGPLHGIVFAIKDQFDTVDMRTTNGADVFFANDRPPDDATLIRRLREAGAIILAKSNMGEYAAGDRSSFGGVMCRERGDSNIRTMTDLIEKANFFTDIRPGSRFTDKKRELERDNMAAAVDLRGRMYYRYAVQQIVLQCMAKTGVDVLVYPTGNIPPPLLGAPTEPTKNGRSHLAWTLLGQQGFPAMTVPAGFTTHVYDRVPDTAAEGGTRLVGPVPAVLPVGIDFLGRPFDEATLFRVASAYEAATHHRVPPRAFGPLPSGSR